MVANLPRRSNLNRRRIGHTTTVFKDRRDRVMFFQAPTIYHDGQKNDRRDMIKLPRRFIL